MAFSHGKNTRLWVDQYEATAYFQEINMAAKAGVAETTVFGKGAKSFIGGIKEGQISGKGFFDAAALAQDQEMTAALGRAANMNVTWIPSGIVVEGTRTVVAYAAETDYAITTPVTNVVATSFAAQADSGLSSGILLYNPDSAAVSGAVTQGNEATTVAAGSNGVNTNTFTGAGVLNVASTTGFPTKGGIMVVTGTSPAYIQYTGTSGTTFTGCTTILGGGALSTGGVVAHGHSDRGATATLQGLVANFHVLTFTGGTSITPKIQHSSDGSTWADLVTGVAATAPGSQALLVAANITINAYIREVITTVGAGTSTTFFGAAARQ